MTPLDLDEFAQRLRNLVDNLDQDGVYEVAGFTIDLDLILVDYAQRRHPVRWHVRSDPDPDAEDDPRAGFFDRGDLTLARDPIEWAARLEHLGATIDDAAAKAFVDRLPSEEPKLRVVT